VGITAHHGGPLSLRPGPELRPGGASPFGDVGALLVPGVSRAQSGRLFLERGSYERRGRPIPGGGGGGSCECMRRSSCHNTGDLMHAGTTNIEHGRNAHAYTFHGPAARSTQTQTCPSKQPIRDSSKEVIHHHVYSHSIPQRVEMKGGGG